MKRILQHKKPADIPFAIKDYLKDDWASIPFNQRGKDSDTICTDCGLPCMRFVYQERETYTAICMNCGKAHRYHATSPAEAQHIYQLATDDQSAGEVIDTCYRKALHATGLDNSDHSGRNYFTIDGSNPFDLFQKDWYKQVGPGRYSITEEGYRFLGYDLLDADTGECKKIIW